jgi:hypothetical protein
MPAGEKKTLEFEKKHRTNLNGEIEKQCSQCHEWKLLNENNFYKWSKSPDSYSAQCNECAKRYTRNKKAANREYFNKIDREYREKNKAVRKIKEKEWRLQHKQHLREYLQEYLKTHPEQSRYYSKLRRPRNHILYDCEWEDCKLFFNYRCAYCGLPIEDHYVYRRGKMVWVDFCREHAVDNGKNDLSNCIPACNSCNVSKNTISFHAFYNPSNPNFSYERYHKIYIWLRYKYKNYIMPKRRYKHQHLESRLKEIELNKIM